MKKSNFIAIVSGILFLCSPALACTDYFCQIISGKAGVSLGINQGYGNFSFQKDKFVLGGQSSFQDIGANGQATGKNSSASFETIAEQGFYFSDKYKVNDTKVEIAGSLHSLNEASQKAFP